MNRLFLAVLASVIYSTYIYAQNQEPTDTVLSTSLDEVNKEVAAEAANHLVAESNAGDGNCHPYFAPS